MLGKFIIAYINDNHIYSPDLDSHRRHVTEGLSKLLSNHLFVKVEKFEFHMTQISFLSYIISTQGLIMDQDKVLAVNTWPTPTTLKELQCFLVFVNFYMIFIRGLSSTANSLMALLKKGPKCLQWNPKADKAFDKLKAAFTSAPILKHPDPSKPFTVEMDGFKSGVGTVLFQHFGEKPKLHPLAFFPQENSNPLNRIMILPTENC